MGAQWRPLLLCWVPHSEPPDIRFAAYGNMSRRRWRNTWGRPLKGLEEENWQQNHSLSVKVTNEKHYQVEYQANKYVWFRIVLYSMPASRICTSVKESEDVDIKVEASWANVNPACGLRGVSVSLYCSFFKLPPSFFSGEVRDLSFYKRNLAYFIWLVSWPDT